MDRPEPLRDPVEGDGEEGAEEDAGGDGDQRRVLRFGAALEQRRADPRPERGAADEPGERQRAGDQPALESQRREGDGGKDDPNVDQVHASGSVIGAQGGVTAV